MSLRTLGLKSPFKSLFKKTIDYNAPVLTVLDFKAKPQESLNNILVRSDKEIGGYSEANFTISPDSTAKFYGNLNLDLPKDNPEMTRSGYAMFRTKDLKESWLSGSNYWDWNQYQSLALRVRGDNRKYLVNLQANTPLVTDLFQHRLFLETPGDWETVIIPLNDFVMTNWGVIQNDLEINKAEIKTIGIGLLDKTYGPFNLDIDWIKVIKGRETDVYDEQNNFGTTPMGNRGQVDEDHYRDRDGGAKVGDHI